MSLAPRASANGTRLVELPRRVTTADSVMRGTFVGVIDRGLGWVDMSFVFVRRRAIGAAVAVLTAGLVLASSAVAHPPWQHEAQRIDTTTAVEDLNALLSVSGFDGLTKRVVGASCTGQGENAGMAGPYPCRNVDLESFVTLPELGSATGNDIWGWTDPESGREFAIMGTATSTGFVEVTDPKNPVAIGFLPTAGILDGPLWRDIKVYDGHAFIVSENSQSGMQVFDLSRLLDAGPNEIFDADAFYDGVSNTHNISINVESGFAYLVGSTAGSPPTRPNICKSNPTNGAAAEGGGLHMLDISDPVNPTFVGCAINQGVDPDTGDSNNYAHDVECVNYDGPDTRYAGREICFGSNENAMVIYDVTDKANPTVISETDYATDAYTHQGALTEDRKYFIFGDELDEQGATVPNTTSYITPVSDLENPGEPKPFFHETNSIDHNMYVHNDRVFQSNYAAGLRILGFDDASLANGEMTEQGFFDVVPGADPAEFAGTWSNYRFPGSGTTVVSAIENEVSGMFILKPTGSAVPTAQGTAPPPDTSTPPGDTAPPADSTPTGDSPDRPDGVAGPSGPCSNVIAGSKAAEKLNGTAGSDEIIGKGGRDRLNGGVGDDCLRAGGGKDRVNGGPGSDEIKPGRGADRIKARGGDDTIHAVAGGRDRIDCGGGTDVVFADEDKDRVKPNCETVKSSSTADKTAV